MPMVISFYTDHYEEDAACLVVTLEDHKIPHHVLRVESRGSWRANVGFKPTFIRDRLRELQQPLVWLDADARVRRYPELFKLLTPYSFAAYFIPFDQMRPQDRPGGAGSGLDGIASGTMYFNNHKATEEFLDRWIAREKGQHKYGQMVLGECWWMECHPNLETFKLPQRYCRVFDRPWKRQEKGPVVIEHMQSSRKFRKLIM